VSFLFLTAGVAGVAGCSGGADAPDPTSGAVGHASGAGGQTAGTGGAPATPGMGGAPATRGTGGAPATRGTGGAPATRGTGGTPATPGTGGAPATRGTGGAPATPGTGGTPATPGTGGSPLAHAGVDYVFVIAMENEPAAAIYGSSSAPYINNQLLPHYAHATAFTDPLADGIPSEPHYVWMEAGTNKFSDMTFTGDSDPSSSNSTSSTAHLSTQMGAASPPVSWLSYQEGLNSSTGACPVRSSGFYACKHDPFVFFQDVAGSPPSTSNTFCADHHRPYAAASFAQDLTQGKVAQYNFISPNVCNDMHGDSACPSSNVIAAGDAWLSANLPPIINFVNAHQGVLFVMWDEPEGGTLVPFVAIGPGVKMGYTGQAAYTHSSFTKSVDEIFGLPVLPTVTGANDFADLFQPAMFP
jgi:hypothetical protein